VRKSGFNRKLRKSGSDRTKSRFNRRKQIGVQQELEVKNNRGETKFNRRRKVKFNKMEVRDSTGLGTRSDRRNKFNRGWYSKRQEENRRSSSGG
jgi:hypothetical protein